MLTRGSRLPHSPPEPMPTDSHTDGAEHLPPERPQGFLDALLENIEEAIVACDAAGALTVINHAARKLLGIAELRLTADVWADRYDLYLPDGRTRMRREETPLYRALQGERVRDVELIVAPEGGAPRTVLASGGAVYGPEGVKLGAVVVMRDFTERKAAEEARLELTREQAARAEAEARQPAEGRVPRHALARTANAANGHPRLGQAARRRADVRRAARRARSRPSSATRARRRSSSMTCSTCRASSRAS